MSALMVGYDEEQLCRQMYKFAHAGIISLVEVQVSTHIRTGDSTSKCRNWEIGGSKIM